MTGPGQSSRLDEESEAYHYTAPLRLEAWDAEPPDPGSSWRPIEQPNFTAETGLIQVGVLEGSGREFLIGPPLFEYGLTVHVHDLHCRRVLASGIVTMLGMEDGRYHVRDAEPHEAARVLCSEETWPD